MQYLVLLAFSSILVCFSLFISFLGLFYLRTVQYLIFFDISFHFSENDGEVELDDVWFAYPSRPSHMILKVNIFRLRFLATDMNMYKLTYSSMVLSFILCVCAVYTREKAGCNFHSYLSCSPL
jgi:hypothetical protein